MSKPLSPPGEQARRRWLAVLAKAELDELERALAALAGTAGEPPAMTVLRQPETGLVMARARAGGTGVRFNLGEIPVTRCSVRSPAGHIGHGYVRGRSRAHAEMAARFDALLQDEAHQATLLAGVIEPLAAAQQQRAAADARKAQATRVEFFTMVRGEG